MAKSLSQFSNMALAVLMMLGAGTIAQDADFGSCPSVREASQNHSPDMTTDLSCSDANGKIHRSSDGHYMYVQCCTGIKTGGIVGRHNVNDFGACIDRCVEEEAGKCQGVTYDGSISGANNCFLWGQGTFSTHADSNKHHAFIVDPPAEDHPNDLTKLCSTECPYANNQIFKTDHGEIFMMFCGKRHGTTASPIEAASYEECIEQCGSMISCTSVDYSPRTKKCYLGKHSGVPKIDAPGFNSAYSMGCAGACDCEPKSPQEPEPLCPGIHDQIWVIDGQNYISECSYVNCGTPYIDLTHAKTVEDCIQACKDHPGCNESWLPLPSQECGGTVSRFGECTTAEYGTRTDQVWLRPFHGEL